MTHPRSHAVWVKPPGPVADGLKIGLLGGSFNPAHGGHLHVSEVALARLGLDYVWWLVSPQNPLKPAMGMAPFAARLARARALATHPRIRVTGIEAEFGTRYTIDTLRRLQRRFAHVRFVWLMGSDNLIQFARWRDWPAIAAAVPIGIVIRPGSVLAPLRAKLVQRCAHARQRSESRIALAPPPAFVIVDSPRNPLSATAMRHGNVTGRTDGELRVR